MPIINNNTVIPRIRINNNTEVRRIFRGTELLFGVFDAIYKVPASSSGNSVKNDTTNPSTFTWGIGIPALKNPSVPSGTTFVKWCLDAKVKTGAPSINKTLAENTIRYALVYKTTTMYRGYYEWDE